MIVWKPIVHRELVKKIGNIRSASTARTLNRLRFYLFLLSNVALIVSPTWKSTNSHKGSRAATRNFCKFFQVGLARTYQCSLKVPVYSNGDGG